MKIGVHDGTTGHTFEVDEQNLWVEVIVGERRTYVGSLYVEEYPTHTDFTWGTAENGDAWWEAENPVTIRPLRFRITFSRGVPGSADWYVHGNRPDPEGDLCWGHFTTLAAAMDYAVARLKEYA